MTTRIKKTKLWKLYLYVRFKGEINRLYQWHLKEYGNYFDERASWLDRTNLWMRSE